MPRVRVATLACTRAALFWVVMALGACATPSPKMPPPPPPPPAAVLEAAPSGMTRLYLLRPGFSDASRRESPSVLIDGRPILDIAHKSYSSLVLAPGRHELSLRPGPFDARSWAARISFKAAPNDILFLAVLKEFDPAPGVAAASGGVTFEFMRQVDAMPLLPELVFIRPGTSLPGSRP